MNNEFNNYNQINRVVTPIKVNEVGNIVSNKSDIEINVKRKRIVLIFYLFYYYLLYL